MDTPPPLSPREQRRLENQRRHAEERAKYLEECARRKAEAKGLTATNATAAAAAAAGTAAGSASGFTPPLAPYLPSTLPVPACARDSALALSARKRVRRMTLDDLAVMLDPAYPMTARDRLAALKLGAAVSGLVRETVDVNIRHALAFRSAPGWPVVAAPEAPQPPVGAKPPGEG